MNLTSLITATAVGALLGLGVRVAAPAWHPFPLWLPPVVGGMAAVAGTLAAWLVGDEPSGLLLNLLMQVFFAGTGVMAMLFTAGQRPQSGQ